MKLKHFAATALIALALVTSPASFASIVGTSNLNNFLAVEAFIFPTTFWRAQSFTVASDQDYLLSDVQMINRNADSSTFLRIYADNASTPGALLEQLSFSSALPTTIFAANGTPISAQLLTFSSSGLSLTASSTYWIVAGRTSGVGSWFGTTSTTETGLPGWAIGNSFRTSSDAGASWTVPASYALYTTINVNPQNVPEPSILALIGIAGISLLRRRKMA
ncbi:MAG: PEP-CTERM sorting domain-containing protein [Methylococcaceae bacterium]|nr:PEP-CTERM sorting domain-containing protein [Methylococcaceae bacterium]